LDFAHDLADQAAIRLLRWFGSATAATKYDGSFVTEADLEVDHFIRDAVLARYPGHSLLTEESSQLFAGAEYTWVVDPLDGTNNFAHGLPLWGISLALLHRGEPVLGVVDFPPIGQRWSAVRGQGATWNGQPLRVQAPAELHGNHFCLIDARSFRLVDFSMRPKARLLGSAAYDLAAISRGVAVACCELLPKIWDIAAAWLVLTEAGATVAPLFDGPPIFPLQPGVHYADRAFPVLAAASPAIWQTVRAGIHLKPGSQRLAQWLQSQGWAVEL
jgi:myo-inositol-1(or 4)-monophosphatase